MESDSTNKGYKRRRDTRKDDQEPLGKNRMAMRTPPPIKDKKEEKLDKILELLQEMKIEMKTIKNETKEIRKEQQEFREEIQIIKQGSV